MFNPLRRKKSKADSVEPMDAPFGPPPMGSRPPERRIFPIDEVRALASRGISEPDIIRTLRREGYSTSEIDQAMKDALRSRISGDMYRDPPQYEERGMEPEELPDRDDIPRDLGYPGSDFEEEIPMAPLEPLREPELPEMPSGEYFSPSPPRRPVARTPQKSGMDRREIEELTEVIIDEKLRDVRERFKAVDSQFQQLSRKMDIVSDEMNRIRSEKSGEVKGIESKIDNYSRNMDEMNGRIESMEKALKDSLSPMLESLRSLAELVKSMRERQAK